MCKLIQHKVLITVILANIALVVVYGAGMVISRTEAQQPPWPEWAARPTATADTSSTVDAVTGAARLASVDPRLGTVFGAVARGDVAGFLRQINWSQRSCGARDAYCPGAASGATADVVDAGSGIHFYVTAAGLEPSLRQVLMGEPLKVTFISRSKENPAVYHVGLDAGFVKAKGLLPLTDPGLSVTGLFLTLDTSAPQPIVALDFGVSTQMPAVTLGLEEGSDQELITVGPLP
jgi:hypothetical protein